MTSTSHDESLHPRGGDGKFAQTQTQGTNSDVLDSPVDDRPARVMQHPSSRMVYRSLGYDDQRNHEELAQSVLEVGSQHDESKRVCRATGYEDVVDHVQVVGISVTDDADAEAVNQEMAVAFPDSSPSTDDDIDMAGISESHEPGTPRDNSYEGQSCDYTDWAGGTDGSVMSGTEQFFEC